MMPPRRLQPIKAWAIVDATEHDVADIVSVRFTRSAARQERDDRKTYWGGQYRVVPVRVGAWTPPKQKKR